MSTGSAVGLSGDVRLLRTLKTVLPALNLKLIAPPAPVPNADAASPAEIRVALVDEDYPDSAAVLKWLEPGRRIPVILMREEDAPLSRSLRGAAAVLSKPLDPNKLRAAVELLVPDWDDGVDREPRLAEILDLFAPQMLAPDPDGKPVREALPLGPKTEDEIDRILGPALAELGIQTESHETPFQAEPPSPRLPDPVPLHPKLLPLPSSGGARMSPPASAVPEEFLDAPESVPETLSQSVRRPIPTPGEGEPPFASPGPAARGRSRRIPLIAGLIIVALIGAAYLGFGRRTPIQAPLAAAPAPAVEQAVVRSDKRDATVAKASLPDPSAVQKPAAETKPAETIFEGVMASPPAAPALQPEGRTGTESELLPPIKAPAETAAKPEPEANPPAGEKAALPAAAAAKDESAPKAKTEETPAAAKTAAEPSARPEPVKSGDLVDLSAVDIPPALLNSVQPVYPPLAYRNKQQAKVALTVLISEKGEILEAKPAADPGVDLVFVKAAQRAVRRWSYSPAFKGGVAVRVWKTLIIDFRIR